MSFASHSSRGSSRSASMSPPKPGRMFGSDHAVDEELRYNALEANNIVIMDEPLNSEEWSALAFSLGMSAKEVLRHNQASQKLAQRMNKKKTISAATTMDYMRPFIESLMADCTQLTSQERQQFHHDPVPSLDSLKNTTNRLPTPRPACSIGYQHTLFTRSQNEIQEGIIAGPSGEPCDLNRISQPVTGHLWPFLVIEASDQSLTSARQTSAVSGATCNHAVELLAGAAVNDPQQWQQPVFDFDRKFIRSFSLSVSAKVACLSTHSLERGCYHVSRPIGTYHLSDPDEVALLAHRLHSIMVWARFNRLEEILALLDQLKRKIYGIQPGLNMISDPHDFDPANLKGLKMKSPRRPDFVRVAFKAGLPSWLKA